MRYKGYRAVVEDQTNKAFKKLEAAFQKRWSEDDETLNEGDIDDREDWSDESENY